LPTNSRNGSLFGGDEIEGDGSQLDMGVLEFNRVTPSVREGRGGKATKHFATEWKIQNLEKSYSKPHQGIHHL